MNFSDNNIFERCLTPSINATDNWVSELKFWTEIFFLCVLILLVVVGNCFVLLALLIDKQLRNPTHYFICSLAMADLTLGIFVLPFAALFQMRGVWVFGPFFCQIWLGIDVWLCTASIYSLIAVTFDRYIAVTKPLTYKSVMTHRRACILIVAVWTVSLIICLPAFALSVNRTYRLATTTCQCTQMAHSAVYIAYSSTGSFYLPMIIILYLYARIYVTVRRIRLSGNSGIVMTNEKKKKIKTTRKTSKNPPKQREHISLIEKGRQLSAVLRVHKGGYHPARKISSRKGLVGRLSAGFRQRGTPTLEEPPNFSTPGSRRTSATNDEIGLGSPNRSENGMHKFRLNIAAKRFLTASCPSSGANSPRTSISADPLPGTTMASTTSRRTSASSSTQLGHDLVLHLTMPSQLTTMWCQRMMAFQKYQKKFSLELRALKTVGIVTGCFFLSWLGFCVVYTMQAMPSCRPAKNIFYSDTTTMSYRNEDEVTTRIFEAVATITGISLSPYYSSIDSCVPDWVVNLMIWLGYVNSAINPIIYGISNQQFRRTFRRILRCEFIKCCEPKSE